MASFKMKIYLISVLIMSVIGSIKGDSSPTSSSSDLDNSIHAANGKDDTPNSGDLDVHGCDLSDGQFFCHASNKCVSNINDCVLGHYDSTQCKYFYNNTLHEFDYDLSQYILSSDKYYQVSDSFTHAQQIFRYYFNLCKPVSASLLPPECATTKGSASDSCSSDTEAYQYFEADWGYKSCYRLSRCDDSNSESQAPTIQLGILNPVEPATGIFVQYSGGDTCPNSYSEKAQCNTVIGGSTYCSRSFRLNILCNDEITDIPLRESVVEDSGCSYTATINHRMGCPIQCPRNSANQICSARGVCYYAGYDSGQEIDNIEDVSIFEIFCIYKFNYVYQNRELVFNVYAIVDIMGQLVNTLDFSLLSPILVMFQFGRWC